MAVLHLLDTLVAGLPGITVLRLMDTLVDIWCISLDIWCICWIYWWIVVGYIGIAVVCG
jgi:hypothetical protein